MQLDCEATNMHDRTAAAVKKPESNTVSYVLREIARKVFQFLRKEGTTGHCIITGRREKDRSCLVHTHLQDLKTVWTNLSFV